MAKPASGTALDTGHALYTSLTHCWPFYENTGNPQDVKGTNHTTKDASVTWSTDTAGDVALAFSDNTVASPLAISNPAIGTTTTWSLAWRGKQTAANDYGMVAGDGTNYVWMRDANYVRAVQSGNGGVNLTGVTSFTTEADYVLVFEYIPGVSNLWRLFKNGTQQGSDVSAGGGFNATTLGGGFANLALEGTLSYVYFWSGRALTGAEATTLAADPYVIFQSSGGGLSIPVAMNQYRQRWR